MGSLHNLVKEKSGHLKVARGEARRASCEAAQLAEALDLQIATEESRIQERAKRMSVQMVNEHLEQLREERASVARLSSATSACACAAASSPQSGAALPDAPIAVRGTSFLRRINSGKDRKWLGAGLGGSMKKVGSALGLQKTSPTEGAPPSPNPPSSLIDVPEQYRLSSAEVTETIEERLSKSQAPRASSLGESSGEVAELNTTDRTRTMHKVGGGARATVVDRGSCQSLEEISDACDEAVQISMPS